MFEQYGDVVTVGELAKMLRVGRNTAYELVRSNQIPSVKIGRQIRVAKMMVAEYIARQPKDKGI
jgi:excisionase family DNA binding protein